MNPWPPGIFVVGTDTSVGKTRVAAAIARSWMLDGHKVGVLKPVSTGGSLVDGTLRSDDVEALIAAISTAGAPFPSPPHDRVGPLRFEAPLAPPVAARRAGVTLLAADVIQAVDNSIHWWANVAQADLIVVEGVGGLLCPVGVGGWTVADLAVHLDYPLVIVAHRGLGTLNHTLLTVEAAQSRGLRVGGVILNATRAPTDPAAEATNAAELAALLPGVAILADWDFKPDQDRVPVAPKVQNWVTLAQTPRRAQSRAVPGDSISAGPIGQSRFPGSDDELTGALASSDLLATSSASPIPAGERAVGTGRGTLATDESGFTWNLDPLAPRKPSTEPDDAPEDEVEARPSSWRNIVLTSYASAVTLGLIWTYAQSRAERRAVVAPPPQPVVSEQFSDQGQLGNRSRKVEPIQPIPADHLIPLGKAQEFGSLRVEPTTISRQDVRLVRVNLVGNTERREGPKGALVLRLKLQNRSSDLVFAPVDPSFVRGRSDNVFETLLELDDGRKVYPNPLAVESEWTVAGETFADLRPGESREVVFATDANAPANAERLPGTWRIKLRTGLDTTTTIGIRLPGAPSKP